MYTPTPDDIRALKRDKYGDNVVAEESGLAEDMARLAAGEPLAYVIGWIPFLGLKIHLDSRPLIPRPETEWWTEKLLTYLQEKFSEGSDGGTPGHPFTFLDLCAGSGAIGLAVLKAFPQARVSLGEIDPSHCALIKKNIEANGLDMSRVDIHESDLFEAFETERFNFIATNPPYIPAGRAASLDPSVTDYEPAQALYSGADGLDLIRRIVADAPAHMLPGGELWIECDVENAEAAKECAQAAGLRAALHTDQYGRARLVVAYLG